MKARISHLHKQEADWLKLIDWIPEAGELIIYDPDDTYPYTRLKIGDGKTILRDLDFFIDKTVSALIQKQHDFEIIDAGRVTDYKN